MTLPPPPDRWTIELANAQRLDAIAAFGFTERQARFLLNVLLHSGVFVERQYCAFAGIVHGQKSTDFITSLVERRFATPIATGKLHRGRMFHVHYKPLWAAIGEPDSRFRKPNAPGRMIERVMLLDAVLDDRDYVWLGPSIDKRRHFMRHLDGSPGPARVSAPAVRRRPREDSPVLSGQAPDRHAAVRGAARLRLPRDAPVADGFPDVPPAAHGAAPGAAPLDGPPAASAPASEVAARLSACRAGASGDARSTRLSTEHAGVVLHRAETARRTRRWACRRTLSEPCQRLPLAEVSGAVPTVAGRSRRTPFGWPVRASSPTTSTAATGRSSASSCHGSTSISLPWLTSPDPEQQRTTWGTTSKKQVVPDIFGLLSFPRPGTRAHRRRHLASNRFSSHRHDLRHEYTSRLVERGVPLAQVRDLLGHASILTTERYDNQRLEALQAAVERLEGGKTFDPKIDASDRVSRIFQDPTEQSFARSEDPAKESATSH